MTAYFTFFFRKFKNISQKLGGIRFAAVVQPAMDIDIIVKNLCDHLIQRGLIGDPLQAKSGNGRSCQVATYQFGCDKCMDFIDEPGVEE